MQNLFVSTLPGRLYLSLCTDPNREVPQFLKISGLQPVIHQFSVALLDTQLHAVFSRTYANWKLSHHSLIELFPDVPSGKYVLRLNCDEFEGLVNITL
ncbi:MAG: hypothetical protein KDC12_11270 [Flavobacteriales bacterium]|nr:hypothetical protein [Flavobacteriales bacterium]